jgi:hypothetical protein
MNLHGKGECLDFESIEGEGLFRGECGESLWACKMKGLERSKRSPEH